MRFCSEESDQDGVESKSTSILRMSGINPEWDRSLPAMSLTQEPTAAIPQKNQTNICKAAQGAELQLWARSSFSTSKEMGVLLWTVDFIRNFLLIHQ